MVATRTIEKVDFSKSLRDLYGASATVREVDVDMGYFIYVDGQGEPGGSRYSAAIGKLYGVGYGLKYLLKNAGVIDFTVSKLECLYFVPDAMNTPMSVWKWRLMMRVPAEVTQEHLAEVQRALTEGKGEDASEVRLAPWTEGRCLQLMHIGPYDHISEAYELLLRSARERGMAPCGPGHEIYIGDPRRAAPENLKTVVRMPVTSA